MPVLPTERRTGLNGKTKISFTARIASAPYVLWAIVFIVTPMLFVAYYAFTDRGGSFTLDNFVESFDYTGVFLQSIWYGLISTFVCFLLAYPLAYIIAKKSGRSQKVLLLLVMLPMWMNLLIRTYAWMTILQDTGVINSVLRFLGLGTVHMINTGGAVVLGMVYNFFPYMILPIYSVMTKLERSYVEAAQDLGANAGQVLKKVIFPLTLPGVVSGCTMVFVPSVSTFYISQKLGNTKLIGDIIETQFKAANNYHVGASLSLVLMVMILICLMVMNRFADDDGGGLIV